MPSIHIRRPHHLPMAEARARVEQVAARMQEKFGLAGDWQGDTLGFSRPGLTGSIAVEREAIEVQARLGMMLTPLKGVIEQEIRRKLEELFA
jgi:putative polyhydroxyalkanoate system protein